MTERKVYNATERARKASAPKRSKRKGGSSSSSSSSKAKTEPKSAEE